MSCSMRRINRISWVYLIRRRCLWEKNAPMLWKIPGGYHNSDIVICVETMLILDINPLPAALSYYPTCCQAFITHCTQYKVHARQLHAKECSLVCRLISTFGASQDNLSTLPKSQKVWESSLSSFNTIWGRQKHKMLEVFIWSEPD